MRKLAGDDLLQCELIKGHLVVQFIRTQERADRFQSECIESALRHEGRLAVRGCLDQVRRLRRKAARYLRMYEIMKHSRA